MRVTNCSIPVRKTFVTLSLAAMATVFVVFVACSKTTSTGSSTSSNPNHIPPDQTVTASLQGRVVDENGIPVQGAVVTSGVATTSTDINGLFSFSKISMSSRFGYVKVVKQGYFEGSRSIITNPSASNYVYIQLIPRTAAGTFAAPSGGKIVVGTGDTVTFAASSVVEASSGTAYTGVVTVYASYLNPTDPNLYKYMPGDLRGIGSNGYETALQSFGMIDVEMQDASGNPLQLASGQPATVTCTIPDSLLSIAPAAIPLWYFNDTTGRWIQQGTALRQGNSYIGLVGHFTFWDWSQTFATVNFKVRVVDQYGNPLAYHYIEFTSPGFGYRGGYTDSAGYAQGLIPEGVPLLLEVLSECGGWIGGVNVGPALSDQNLGTVTVNIVNAELTVTGNVVDCSNNPVDSGYVEVEVDGLFYEALLKNGAFSLPITRCVAGNAPVRLFAHDFTTTMESTVTTITANSGTVNVGTLSACSVVPTAQYYINFTVSGSSYSYGTPLYPAIEDTIQVPMFSAGNFPAPNTISLIHTSINGTGTFSGVGDSAIVSISSNSGYHGPVTYTITAFGPQYGSIQGSFSGTVVSYAGNDTAQLSGTFNVKRIN